MMFAALGPFGDAIEFIFEARESQAGTVQVGGLKEVGELTLTHLELSLVATAVATLIAMPIGLWLGHIGRYQFLATSTSNIGRAVPALGLIVFFIAFLGVGFLNVCVALVLLAIPPIITNTYVGVRGVDPETVDAANGNGLTGLQVAKQVELPLALPTIMGGIRIALVSVIATATIAPLANVDTLGRPIVSPNVYGTAGQLAACLVVAVVTFAADGLFAAVQRAVTPKGIRLQARGRSTGRFPFLPTRRSVQSTGDEHTPSWPCWPFSASAWRSRPAAGTTSPPRPAAADPAPSPAAVRAPPAPRSRRCRARNPSPPSPSAPRTSRSSSSSARSTPRRSRRPASRSRSSSTWAPS